MTYTLLSDEELFALVRDGNDEQAYRALFKRYDKRVYAYCLRALGSHDDAQDMFQTISMTVFDKRQSFSDGSFAAWLFTIARNFCLKALRGRKHTTELTDETMPVEEEETRSEDFLLRQALHKAIGALPDEFRSALEMKYFDDLAYEDIAKALDITVSLAKVRVFRAKKLIQQSMSTIIDELR
ncbi:MAG: RNA polymerase sigma factor [Candidatus Kapabacteria bacterium]|nr:RNA polymerase sigma factor [Candidatus Kapabacteria bacterium]